MMTMDVSKGETAKTPTGGGPTGATSGGQPGGGGGPGGAQECAGCGKPITERFLLKALDLYWHEDCLKCGCCDCRLGEVGSTLYTKANLILCKRDYLRYEHFFIFLPLKENSTLKQHFQNSGSLLGTGQKFRKDCFKVFLHYLVFNKIYLAEILKI